LVGQVKLRPGLISSGSPLTYRKIFWFWLPLAGTWLMMAAEGPYLAAVIARLDDPIVNLAAFGVTFAFAIIIESPVIMLMSASTALVADRESYLALRRFSYGLSALLTLVQVGFLAPPVFDAVCRGLALPDEVARLTHGGLLIMLPWTGAIGYRRFRQGLLIRANLTRRLAYGTAIRLVTMSVCALTAYRHSSMPGAHIGALALSVGVVVEAVASRFMTASVLPGVLGRRAAAERLASLRLGALVRFYGPLALTSLLALAAQPTVTFFMGQSRYAIESLAVLPVIHGLTFIFRSIGLSYLEVVIALIGRRREHFIAVRNFSLVLAVAAATGLSTIAFSPLASVWLHELSGLSVALTEFAVPPLRILAILPALSVVLSFQRGLLVHARRNTSITWATLVELLGVATVLAIGIHFLDLAGAVAAATAIMVARVAGNLYLVPTCVDVIRNRPHDGGQVIPVPTTEAT